MKFELKPISKESVRSALEKAERYRVIGDPSSAESICLDVLQADPGSQPALVTLLLAITDQFADGPTEGVRRAREVLAGVTDEYKRAYYAGIICERCAKTLLRGGGLGTGNMAYHWLQEAMTWYQKAQTQRPTGNDESILRWNACARFLTRNEQLQPRIDEPLDPTLE